MPNDFNKAVIDEFRANDGRVGGYFEGAALILVTTTGARSGTPHTTPLGPVFDADGQLFVIGSAGGSDRHPDWFRNVQANSRVKVEDGSTSFSADAQILDKASRDAVFAVASTEDPGWAEYQAGTTRELPVVALRRI